MTRGLIIDYFYSLLMVLTEQEKWADEFWERDMHTCTWDEIIEDILPNEGNQSCQ